MPNWVYNQLTVSGDTATLDQMVTQLNSPFSTFHQDFDGNPVETQYPNPVFAFWNIIKPTDLEAYYGEEVFKKEKNTMNADGSFDSQAFMQEFTRSIAEDNDWWHWNVRNWGTKWDVAVSGVSSRWADTEMERDGENIVYRFQTAWDVPQNAIILLSEQYPTLQFALTYEEEQGWGGEVEIQNGEVTVLNEYDIPECHQDFVDRDQECWACSSGDDESLFPDCPRITLDSEAVSVVS